MTIDEVFGRERLADIETKGIYRELRDQPVVYLDQQGGTRSKTLIEAMTERIFNKFDWLDGPHMTDFSQTGRVTQQLWPGDFNRLTSQRGMTEITRYVDYDSERGSFVHHRIEFGWCDFGFRGDMNDERYSDSSGDVWNGPRSSDPQQLNIAQRTIVGLNVAQVIKRYGL